MVNKVKSYATAVTDDTSHKHTVKIINKVMGSNGICKMFIPYKFIPITR